MNNRKLTRAAIIVLFIALSAMSRSTAQPAGGPDWPLVHTRTMEGIDVLYNFRFHDAEAKFNDVIRMAPQDPRGYFFKAMISYYQLGLCYLRNGQKDLAKNAFKKALEFEKYIGEDDLRGAVEGELDKIKD